MAPERSNAESKGPSGGLEPDYFRPYFQDIEKLCRVYYVTRPKIEDFKGLERHESNLVKYPTAMLAEALTEVLTVHSQVYSILVSVVTDTPGLSAVTRLAIYQTTPGTSFEAGTGSQVQTRVSDRDALAPTVKGRGETLPQLMAMCQWSQPSSAGEAP